MIARLDSAPAYFGVTPSSLAEPYVSIKNKHVRVMPTPIRGISLLLVKTTKREMGWKPPLHLQPPEAVEAGALRNQAAKCWHMGYYSQPSYFSRQKLGRSVVIVNHRCPGQTPYSLTHRQEPMYWNIHQSCTLAVKVKTPALCKQ